MESRWRFCGGGDKEKKVLVAWRAYHDHLNDKSYQPDRMAEWQTRQIDLLIDLLQEMAVCLGCSDFDKTYIKNSWYAPQGHVDLEEETQTIRQGFAAIFSGKKSFPVTSFAATAEDAKEWTEVRTLLIEVLRAIKPDPGVGIQVNIPPRIPPQLSQGESKPKDEAAT
jgi:uncharacterized protein DUF6680